ncbi:MAG: CHAT domain-containing protein, partial [Bacteroidota bacterium]
MCSLRRCNGRLGLLALLLLFGLSLFAQSSEREQYVTTGTALLEADSLVRAREQLGLVTAGPADSLSGLAWHKIGLSYYQEANDAAAAAAYRQALVIRDEIFPANHLDRAHTRSNLASSLIYLGQTDSAGLLLREAIDIYATAPDTDTLNWLLSLADLMQVSIELRDYRVSVNAARSALGLLPTAKGISAHTHCSILYRSGSAFYRFGDLERGEVLGRRMLAYAEEEGDAYDKLQAYNLLMVVAEAKEQTQVYQGYAEKALAIAQTDEADPLNLGLLHFNLAQSYVQAGKFDRAANNANRAEALLTDAGPQFIPSLLVIRGDLAHASGDGEAALSLYQEALNLLGGAEPDSLAGFELINTAELVASRAKVLAELGRDDAALEDYELLFTVQDLLRARVSSDESRRYLSQDLRPYFDKAINLLVDRYAEKNREADLWRALELSERAKAYSLLTSLQRDRRAMSRQEAELRTRIAELERKVTGDPEREPQLVAARLQLDRLIRLSQEEPELTAFRLNRDSVAGLLTGNNPAILVYHLGEDRAFLFVVHRNKNDGAQLSWTEIAEPATLPARTEAFREAILASSYRRKSLRETSEQRRLDAAFLGTGLQLTGQLLSDLNLPAGSLTVIPDGALNYLPFGCLPLEESVHPVDYSVLTYLPRKQELSYAYSLAFLQAVSAPATKEYDRNLAAFAPDFRGSNSPTAANRAIKRIGERALPGLSPLRYNQPEVTAIGKIIPGAQTYLAAEATRRSFLDNTTSSRILHLSTHGMVNAADPRLSFVAFSQRGDSLELEEMLYFNDLSALPLATELAVLSACETNLGAYVPGETTLSLASAFAAAGARSTLTTLWQVDDAATKDIMVRFYEELAAGKSRNAA